MASPSSQRGAARAPPPPDQLTAFYKLVDKHVIAGHFVREARDAELSAQAAVHAEALFGDDSLVAARLRLGEFESLANMRNIAGEASGAEREALFKKSWAALVSVVPLLLRRAEANTLLPGTIREEELDYEAHVQAVLFKLTNQPNPPPAALRAAVCAMGYNILLRAMCRSLNLLPEPLLSAAQKRLVESFVLQGLGVIPRTAGIPENWIAGEDRLVAILEEEKDLRFLEPTFRAALLRKWRSNAVSSVLRARGVLQNAIGACQKDDAEFQARQRADIGKHGLRDCALPSCSKTEKTVKEFAGCSGCRSVVYCCLEHQALDWKAHKKACREKDAARQAAEKDADNEAGAGAAAA